MFDVFISYPHQDKPAADAACAALEAMGVRCWIAPRDIEPGAEWAASIIEAIEQCKVMVLIFSGNANRSKQVQREVQNACDRDVPVIPLRVENVAPARGLAFFMGPVHWLDALTPPLEQHLGRLTQRVTALLSTPQPRAGAQQAAPEQATPVAREEREESPARSGQARPATQNTVPNVPVERRVPPTAEQPSARSATSNRLSSTTSIELPPSSFDKLAQEVVRSIRQGEANKSDRADGKRGLAAALASKIAKLSGTTPQGGRPSHLFISHAIEDSAVADQLCAALENRGVRCWMAPRDIAMGETYQSALPGAIERSRGMLLIFSRRTNDSHHVLRELELAEVSNIPIYPLRIDIVEPTGGLAYMLAHKRMME